MSAASPPDETGREWLTEAEDRQREREIVSEHWDDLNKRLEKGEVVILPAGRTDLISIDADLAAALKLLRELLALVERQAADLERRDRAFDAIVSELGVPGEGYPQNVANAYVIARDRLELDSEEAAVGAGEAAQRGAQ